MTWTDISWEKQKLCGGKNNDLNFIKDSILDFIKDYIYLLNI